MILDVTDMGPCFKNLRTQRVISKKKEDEWENYKDLEGGIGSSQASGNNGQSYQVKDAGASPSC